VSAATASTASRARVAFVTDIPTPYMSAVMAALAERVELVAIFCSAEGTRGLGWELGDLPFRHEIIGGLKRRRPVHTGGTDLHLSPRVLSALVRHAPDAVISGAFSIPSAYAAAYCAVRSVPLIIHSDGTERSEEPLSRLQRASRTILAPLADAAAANSKPAAERFRQLGFAADRVHLVPHSTNLQPFLEAGERRDYGGAGELRVLATGRLISRKGLDHLLRAYAIAGAQRPGITLRIVGSGPAEADLRRLARELDVRVDFDGFVDQPHLPAAYATAQAYVFPTLRDPFGIVVLEAAASGLPIVASPHGGATPDLIEDERTGLVCDPLDHTGVAAALVRLADDPDLRRRLGNAARDEARHRTPDATAAGYVEAVSAALQRRRPRSRRPRQRWR
jgi:glycosyltransferase involved in cell wall biosynthesis